MRIKLWLLMLVLVGGGGALIYLGGRNVIHNRKLAEGGKTASAIVINKREQLLYKNNKSLHVTVAFQTEAGQKIQDELMVYRNIYESAVPGKPIDVLYSPKDPSVFIIGRVADVNYTKFGSGWVFLGLGVLLCWFLKKHPTAGVIKTFTEKDMLEETRPVATKAAKTAHNHSQGLGLSPERSPALEEKKGDPATNRMFEEILKEHQPVQAKSPGKQALT
jgi:hypothetical protein